MRTYVSVVFGTRREALGWVTEHDLEIVPSAGTPVRIKVGEGSMPSTATGQVYRSWEPQEEEPGGIFIFAGAELPDESFREEMEDAGWEPLTGESLGVLIDLVTVTPVIAAAHEVTVAIGNPHEPERLFVFQRTLYPVDPALPLFGQRLRLAIESVEFGSDEEDESEGVIRINREIHGELPINEDRSGLPCVVVYSSMVDPGTARICLWTPSLGVDSPAVFVENDWKTIAVPQQFDPVDFRLARRIELGVRTGIVFDLSSFGTSMVKEWTIEGTEDILEEDHALLPPMLIEHIKAQREFEELPLLLEEWSKDLN